jgi:hypothetical protein
VASFEVGNIWICCYGQFISLYILFSLYCCLSSGVGLLHVRLDAEFCKLCACLFVEGDASCACSDVSLY